MSEVIATLSIELDGKPQWHLHVDPRCLAVDVVRGRPVARLAHDTECECGDMTMRLRATP